MEVDGDATTLWGQSCEACVELLSLVDIGGWSVYNRVG